MASLVLSGAGSKIGLHVGFCEKLLSENIKFDKFAGTSAGSILCACFACGYSIEKIRNLFQKEDFKKLVIGRGNRFFSFFKLFWYGYVDSGNRFSKFLFDLFGKKKFRDLEKDLYVVAYCLDKREVVVFCKSDTPDIYLADAVFASSCLPFVFKPKEIDGFRFVDGGIAKNFPVDIPQLDDCIYGNLVEPYNCNGNSRSIIKTVSFFKELFDGWFYANDVVSIKDARMLGKDLKITRSYYDIDTFTFNITDKDKEKMFSIGYNAAEKLLDGEFYI